MTKEDFEIEPDLGAADPEPSLGEVVFWHYQRHLGTTAAVAMTESYIAALVGSVATTARAVAYLHSHPDHPDEIDKTTLTAGDKAAGWSQKPLYAVPPAGDAVKKIVDDLMERMDWMGTGSIASGDSDRKQFEQRIKAAGLELAA
jgi:hypothetical protein